MRYLDALIAAKEKRTGNVVIPDIKVFSPKEGDLMQGRDPVVYAGLLAEAGAPVLSVVTEEKEFHGSLQMLRDIAQAVSVPILRKDFIHTRRDLEETVEAGASAILLMCSCLEPDELRYLYREALALGLDPFVETHREEDFALVEELGAKLVGINNRDITVLERDEGNVSHTQSLSHLAPADAFLVTESSIRNADQVRMAIAAGADAALVGTAILSAENTVAFYRMLCRKCGVKICGFMNAADAAACAQEGVDRLGAVAEYPVNVPWNLGREQVKQIRDVIPQGSDFVIVTGGSSEHILEVASYIRPDYVQLHYKETLEQVTALAHDLHQEGIGVICTIPAGPADRMAQYGTEDVIEVAKLLQDTEVDELLWDARHHGNAAQKNLELDADLAKALIAESARPVAIAGGLCTDNLEKILKETGAYSIDLMNGSEDAPGKKSIAKVRALLKIAQQTGE